MIRNMDSLRAHLMNALYLIVIHLFFSYSHFCAIVCFPGKITSRCIENGDEVTSVNLWTTMKGKVCFVRAERARGTEKTSNRAGLSQ